MRWLGGWSLNPFRLWRQLTCRHQWEPWVHRSGARKQVCRCGLEHW